MSEFYSAILGALVGGAIAFAIQLLIFREQKKQLEKNERILDEAAIYRLTLNFHKFHQGTQELNRVLDKARANAAKIETKELWRTFLPIPNLPSAIEVGEEELVFLLKKKEGEILADFRNLEEVYRGTLKSLALYNELRSAFIAKYPSAMDGERAKINVPHERSVLENIEIYHLQSLFSGIETSIARLSEILENRGEAVKIYLENSTGLSFSFRS